MTTKPKPVLAPRRAPDPAALEAFISGASPAPAAPRQADASPPVVASEPQVPPIASATPIPKAQHATPPAGRTTVHRKDGRELRRKTLYLPPELATRLGVQAVRTGQDESDIVSTALAAWLDGQGA